MAKKTILLHVDRLAGIDMLTDEQAGKLLRAIAAVGRGDDHEQHLTDAMLKLAFLPIEQSIRELDGKYNEMVERRKAAAEKRWNKGKEAMQVHTGAMQSNAKQCNAMQSNAKQCYTDTVTDTVTDTDTLSSSNEEEEKESSAYALPKKAAKRQPERVASVSDQWNTICAALPKVATLTERRKAGIRARLRELDKAGVTPEQLMQRVAASSFLCGGGAKGWKATFDWLWLSASNWPKVMEGDYDDTSAPAAAPANASQEWESRIVRCRLSNHWQLKSSEVAAMPTLPPDADAEAMSRFCCAGLQGSPISYMPEAGTLWLNGAGKLPPGYDITTIPRCPGSAYEWDMNSRSWRPMGLGSPFENLTDAQVEELRSVRYAARQC